MELAEDSGALSLLQALGVSGDALLGSGGEAWVLADGKQRVLRIPKPGARLGEARRRSELLRALCGSAHRVPFAIPQILEEHAFDQRLATVETRLPGRTLSEVLAQSVGVDRRELVRRHLAAAAQIGDLELERAFFGELVRTQPLRTQGFRAYLEAAAARSLTVAGADFSHLDPSQIAGAIPECETPSLVHLDAFPGNMLAEDGKITAVLDFGVLSIVGDRRFDPLCSAAYLAPEITPGATAEDWRVAQDWLAEHELAEGFPSVQRWLAAFWSGAVDSQRLQAWSKRVLGISSAP
jgi:aminoglycoside phosphotransferase (APT) family kinase protein